MTNEKYEALPIKEWKSEDFVYSEAYDKFFFDSDDVEDFLLCTLEELAEDGGGEVSIDDLQLVNTAPEYLSEIDPYDYYSDSIGEDQDLPKDIEEAFDALNDVIRNHKTPIVWYPVTSRPDLTYFKL